jgi:Ser/Thr protein kinase RdoA (MazF antagonist)
VIAAYRLGADARLRWQSGRVSQIAGAAGAWAVKAFTPKDAARARLEAALLAHLGAAPHADYRVQVLVETAHGALFEDADGSVLVTRWQEGRFKPYTEIAEDEWAALGRTLGALHARLDEGAHLPVPVRLSERIRQRSLDAERATLLAHRTQAIAHAPGRAQELARYFDDRLLLLEERVPRARARLPDDPERPIHNDYNQYNYLFPSSGAPVILDWERSIGAPREFELVRCLNQLPVVAERSARRFVDGYLGARRLGAAALRWAVDAALSEHAVKHWPVDAWLHGAEGAEDRMAATLETVRAIVRERERLDAFFEEIARRLEPR